VRERLARLGADPWTMPPEQFDAYLRAEVESNGKVVRDAGLKPQ
jgi:tripartite-type tricarboxylate transporter receptor subunit TctC